MNNFRTIDRQTGFLLPPSVDEWLPEKHLARFVVEVIDGMDLRAMSGSYRGSGSASYHPRMLLGILVYGYATGIFSSRKLERATYDSVAFRFIAANDHPDHDTIATFRQRFLKQIEGLFVQVLLLAREMGMLKLGTLGIDGTKIHCKKSPKLAPRSRRAAKNASRASRPSMRPNSQRGRPRLRPRARSQAASRLGPRRRVRCLPIRSISPTKSRASCR